MNQKIVTAVVALGAGVGLALLLAPKRAVQARIGVKDGRQAWDPSQVKELRAVLGASKLTPHGQVERVWVISPSDGGPGIAPALRLAQNIQKRGSTLTASTNLLDPQANPRMIAEVRAGEEVNAPPGSNVAILPPL